MSDYNLSVTIDGNATGLETALQRAGVAVQSFGTRVDNTARTAVNSFSVIASGARKNLTDAQWVRDHSADLTTLGKTLMVTGGLATAASGMAIKAAEDWESAWAGVAKTVDGADLGGVLENQLRGLARDVLPATHQEIAAVAESAGQLGVKRQDVAKFTKTLIMLGEATNMTAESAATDMARFSNIMGHPISQVDRLGATIVALGNNTATTEAEIMEAGLRLASAGRQAQMSSSDVLAWGAALTSAGVSAQVGGTAFSKLFQTMGDATRSGNDKLQTFADTAGMTADQFRRAWEEDASSAVVSFLQGFGKLQEAGEDTTSIMRQLGMTDAQMQRTLGSTALMADQVGEYMQLARQAYEENIALEEEASRRFQTTASRRTLAMNNIRDAAITFGDSLLPAVQVAADGISELAKLIGSMPEPVAGALTSIGLLGGGIMLAGGFAVNSVVKFAELMQTLKNLGIVSSATFDTFATKGSKVFGVGKKAGKVAGWLALLSTLSAVGKSMVETSIDAGELSRRLLEAEQSGDSLSSLFQEVRSTGNPFTDWFSGQFDIDTESFKSALDWINDDSMWNKATSSVASFTEGLAGLVGLDIRAGESKIRDALKDYDKTFAQMASSGNIEDVARQFRLIADTLGDDEAAKTDLLRAMPELSDELKRQAAAAGLDADETMLLKMAQGELVPVVDEATGAVELQDAAMMDAAATVDRWGGAMTMTQEEMAEWVGHVSELSRSFIDLSANTGEAYTSLGDWLSGIEKQVEAMKNWQENMLVLQSFVESGALSGAAFAELMEMGPAGAQIVQDLVDGAEGNTAAFDRLNALFGDAGTGSSEAFAEALKSEAVMGVIGEIMQSHGAEAARKFSAAINEGMSIEEALVHAGIELPPETIEQFKAQVSETTENTPATVNVDANTSSADQKVDGVTSKASSEYRFVVDANTSPARQQTDGAVNYVDTRTGAVTVNAKDSMTGFVNTWVSQLPISHTVSIFAQKVGSAWNAVKSAVGLATGGPVIGPGTATSDSIPAWLSNGEHVWTAEEVLKIGGHANLERLRRLVREGRAPKFATGGRVQPVHYVGNSVPAPTVNTLNIGGVSTEEMVDKVIREFGREVRSMEWRR